MTNPTDKPLFRIVTAAAVLVVCYGGVLWTLADQWATNSTYSYGFAVPLISGYIVWSRWSEIKAAYSAPDYARAAALLLLGVTMLTIGRVGALMSFEGTSLIPTVAGLVLLLGGRHVLRVVWFPLTYLLLMLPVWSYLFRSLEAPSQYLSATIGTRLLEAFGTPALQQGTTIILSSASLDVMPECSGINQLIALTVMALPAAYLWLETGVTRTALVGIAVTIGYLSNGARIAVLGWLTAHNVNVTDGHSPIHLLPGFLTASVAYLIIWGCLSLLSRLKTSKRLHNEVAHMPPSTQRHATRRDLRIEAAMLGLLLFAGSAQLVVADVRSKDDLESLPSDIADWTAQSSSEPDFSHFPGFDQDLLSTYPTPSGQRRFIDMDDEILRTYRRGVGPPVRLYIGYYRRQESGKELSSDVSQGLEHAATKVSVLLQSEPVTLGELEQRKGDFERGVVFWYDVNGRVVDSVYKAKGYTLWDTVTRRRSNGAVVMVAWDRRDGGTREDALAFAQTLLPVLRQHLPS
jgi:EpsI family protein